MPTGNSFSALIDTDAYDAPGKRAANSKDALYKAVTATSPEVGTILRRQDQKLDTAFISFDHITSLLTKLDDRLGKMEESHAVSMAKMVDRNADSMAKFNARHVTSLSQMEERLLAKIDAFSDKFGDLRTDVNDHERHLVALKSTITDHGTRISALTSDLLIQESVIKGYKDTNDTTVATLRTDVNDTRTKFPELRREVQESTTGLATSIKEIDALVHDLRQQQWTPINSETAPTTPPPFGALQSTLPVLPV